MNKYSNTHHRTIKMKPFDVKLNMHIDFHKEINKDGSKFKLGGNVRISKYKNIFAKGYVPNWYEDVLVIKKLKNTVFWTYIISDLNGEKIAVRLYKKELQKANQKKIRVEKLIKRKSNILYAKWKGYDNSFNGWIDQKDK